LYTNFYYNCSSCSATWYSQSSSASPPSSHTLSSTLICGKTAGTYYELNCGKTVGVYYNGSTIVDPTCNQVVSSIVPSLSSQTINYNGTIDSNLIATYLDGHTATIPGVVSGFNNKTVGTQTVTLKYSGRVTNAKTTGTLSTTKSVTVSDYVASISATVPTQSIYYGGNIVGTASITMSSGSTSTVPCTISGFNNTSPGTQTVTLTYTGQTNSIGSYPSCTVSVIVKDYVTSITSQNPTQTVIYNGSIDPSVQIIKASGGTEIVTCDIENYNSTQVGIQTVTLVYSGMTNNLGVNMSCTISVTVQAGLTSISPTYMEQTVYKGTVPDLTVTAAYMDGTSKRVTPTNDFNSNIIGTQTVTLSYTDQGTTKTITCKVTIKPNLIDLTVLSDNTSVLYGTEITFTCTAHYEDGTAMEVIGSPVSSYLNTLLGEQTIQYSYSENGISKVGSVVVEVLDYPITLQVALVKDQIFQTQMAVIDTAVVQLASGNVTSVTPNEEAYDNMDVGNEDITYSYELNGVNVNEIVKITILPDLYDLQIENNRLEIYRGQVLNLNVSAEFEIAGEVVLSPGDYIIEGFDNNIYDRDGTYYNLTYSNKGITITKQLFIRVKPNITNMNVDTNPQTVEGIQVPFITTIKYEDGYIKTITDHDFGTEIGEGLTIKDYVLDLVDYQDITFLYEEGGKTLSKTVTIRVRAIININIPISMLVSIDPNSGNVIAPDISIINASKEPVIVGVQSITPINNENLRDVLPTAYVNWSNLGVGQSKDIALGLYCKNNWMTDYLSKPLYVAQIGGEVDIGILDKDSTGSIQLVISHGNAFKESKDFSYKILWYIKLGT
jgi:hypothetical protein